MAFWKRPQKLRVELTNICNLRCRMCGIWAEKPKKIFDMEQFGRLMEQRALSGVRVISLTGGEPFAVGNIHDYFALARRRHPRAHINFSTNGTFTDETVRLLERAGDRAVSVTISYDGVRSHDALRGVAGSAERLLDTAREVRDRFPEVGLSLKMVATNENHAEIFDTARYCKELRIPFRLKTLEKLNCHQSRFPSEIAGPDYSPEALDAISGQARRVLGLGIDTNRKFLKKLVRMAGGSAVSCGCSPRVAFVGIDGAVFLCRKKEPIGNLAGASFDEIWSSRSRADRVREMAEPHGSALGIGFTHD